MWSSGVGGVKWYGYKESDGEHTALRNDVSTPVTSLCYSMISLSWGIYQLVQLVLLLDQKRLGECLSSVSTWVPYWWAEALEYGGNKQPVSPFCEMHTGACTHSMGHLIAGFYSCSFAFHLLNLCHTFCLCWLSSSWASFLYQHFLSLTWHILEQQQIV